MHELLTHTLNITSQCITRTLMHSQQTSPLLKLFVSFCLNIFSLSDQNESKVLFEQLQLIQ